MGFSGSSDGKESACNAGDPGSIPGWGRPSGEGLATPSRGAGQRLQSMGSQRVIHYWALTLSLSQNWGKRLILNSPFITMTKLSEEHGVFNWSKLKQCWQNMSFLAWEWFFESSKVKQVLSKSPGISATLSGLWPPWSFPSCSQAKRLSVPSVRKGQVPQGFAKSQMHFPLTAMESVQFSFSVVSNSLWPHE